MKSEEMKDVCKRVRAEMVLAQSQAAHPGSLSCVEILSTLYLEAIKLEPVDCVDRDCCFLCNGHGTSVLAAVLSHRGFFLPEALGVSEQGAVAAVDLALKNRLHGTNKKVFALVNDGEMQKPDFWEAMMTASQHKLTNLTVIIDHNSEVRDVGSLPLKMESFGFYVIELNGHDVEQLTAAYSVETLQPKCIIANTQRVMSTGEDTRILA